VIAITFDHDQTLDVFRCAPLTASFGLHRANDELPVKLAPKDRTVSIEIDPEVVRWPNQNRTGSHTFE